MLYSINYDLKGPRADYSALIEAIKAIGKWWHYLDSMWLVVSNDGVQQVYERLGGHIKTGDNLIVLDVTNSAYWGILPRDAWPWIAERQSEERGRQGGAV